MQAELSLTNAELAVLGLVSEEPKYGYQIEQDIVQRGMREWTEIGFSSIYYILNKLEDGGLLGSEKRDQEVRPARKIYHVTAAGRAAYREAVRQRLACPRPRSDDFDLGLANLWALDCEELREALREYHSGLAARLEKVRAKRELDGGDRLAQPARELFDHSLTMMAAELDWVSHLLERLKSLDTDDSAEKTDLPQRSRPSPGCPGPGRAQRKS